jgi:hypothetical protein
MNKQADKVFVVGHRPASERAVLSDRFKGMFSIEKMTEVLHSFDSVLVPVGTLAGLVALGMGHTADGAVILSLTALGQVSGVQYRAEKEKKAAEGGSAPAPKKPGL